jgi:hypothetical protein
MMTNTIDKIKVNKSKTYLLPLLNEYIGFDYIFSIKNTFINIDGFIECIGVLYKKDIQSGANEREWDNYFKLLSENSLFKTTIELENYCLYIFEFPEQYIDEYKYFKLGQYSKFSNEAKKTIIKFMSSYYQYPELMQDIVHILYKNKIRKEKLELELGVKLSDDAELTSIIDEEEETFNSIKYDDR